MSDETPFSLEEATIDELHEAIKAGRTTCVAVVQHYIDRARAYNGVCSVLVTEDGAPVPEAAGTVRAEAPLRFPTKTVKASTISRQIPGAAARVRAHGTDRFRSFGTAAIWDDHRHPKCRTAQRPCDAQHQRRALGDLSRRVRPASFRGTAAAGRAADLRTLPPIARCSGTRGGTRCHLRAPSRSRQDAAVWRRVLVQGPVRPQGHAPGRRRRA